MVTSLDVELYPTERGKQMATATAVDRVSEAIGLLDQGLGDMRHRELVSTAEVADLLLDVRQLLEASRLTNTS